MIGKIGWVDITVTDADLVRDFDAEVAGWSREAGDRGGYSGFTMGDPSTGELNGDVCHARGGELVNGPHRAGSAGSYAVIRDPAGAVCALMQPA